MRLILPAALVGSMLVTSCDRGSSPAVDPRIELVGDWCSTDSGNTLLRLHGDGIAEIAIAAGTGLEMLGRGRWDAASYRWRLAVRVINYANRHGTFVLTANGDLQLTERGGRSFALLRRSACPQVMPFVRSRLYDLIPVAPPVPPVQSSAVEGMWCDIGTARDGTRILTAARFTSDGKLRVVRGAGFPEAYCDGSVDSTASPPRWTCTLSGLLHGAAGGTLVRSADGHDLALTGSQQFGAELVRMDCADLPAALLRSAEGR